MSASKILVVDDEPAIAGGCDLILSEAGYTVESSLSGREGLNRLLTNDFDLVLLDIQFPGINGIDILTIAKERRIDTVVVIMTGKGTVENAVEAMKRGAFDFITKPFGEEQLLDVVDKGLKSVQLVKKNNDLQRRLNEDFDAGDIIGHSPQIKNVFEKIERVAPTESTVLLIGESGTGKELFASAIHNRSLRSDHRFLAVDCSTFAATVMESELFGHVKGAFTGATTAKPGLFEAASSGTFFLDEIASLDMDIQGKLLRVLESGEYKPVGATTIKKTRTRVVGATNRDLLKMVEGGNFREDLYYRLNVFPIQIPPLRERPEDIPDIAYHFLKLFCRNANKKVKGFSDEALRALVDFHWPGNVRQLKNVVERLVIMCDAEQLDYRALMDNFQQPASDTSSFQSAPATLDELKEMKKQVIDENFGPIERAFLHQALEVADGNISRAAKMVGMQRSNFSAMMKKHDIHL